MSGLRSRETVVSASASNAHRAQFCISHLIDVANINLRKPQNRERKGIRFATARSSRLLRQRAIALLVVGCVATLCELRHIIVCPHLLASLHVFRKADGEVPMRRHITIALAIMASLVTLMFFADAAGMID